MKSVKLRVECTAEIYMLKAYRSTDKGERERERERGWDETSRDLAVISNA